MDNKGDETKESDETIAFSSNDRGEEGERLQLSEEGLKEEGKKEKEEDVEGKVEVKDHRKESGGRGKTSPNEYLTGDEESSSSLDILTTASNSGNVVVTHDDKGQASVLSNVITESNSSLDTLKGTEETKRVLEALKNISSSNTELDRSCLGQKTKSTGSLDTLIGGIDQDKTEGKKKTRIFGILKSSSPIAGKSSPKIKDLKYSSQDTLTNTTVVVEEEKKKRRFSALRSSFRKERGSLFKIKRKKNDLERSETSIEVDSEDISEKDSIGDKSPARSLPEAEIELDTCSNQKTKKAKKKSTASRAQALVRKFSLNKFRSQSTDQQQEPRHTPEGGDSSHSQSPSSQESAGRPLDDSSRIAGKELEQVQELEVEEKKKENEKSIDNKEKGEPTRKSENLIVKPVSTITVVQRKSSPLTIRSNLDRSLTKLQHESEEQNSQLDSETCLKDIQCSSTLPYAISKWSDSDPNSRRAKLYVKSESESSAATPKSSPVELRRKLSLLEEKRAIFQQKFFESTQDTYSGETIVAQGEPEFSESSDSVTAKKTARHISVRKFDTFSTFDGTFDEDTGVGYLTGIEEDHTESFNERQNESYLDLRTAVIMGPMIGATSSSSGAQDPIQRTQSTSQDNPSSQNNTHIGGSVGDKREHLYKILVIGELGAGKTSIIKRYVHQFFSQHYRATIGVDFALKVLNWDPHTIIRLQLWDIAGRVEKFKRYNIHQGQERFGNMTRVYYKEAVGAFIVFDVTRGATLDAVVKWKQDLDSKVQLPDGTPIPCVLLANKCDQQKEGMVNSPNKMDEYCKEKNFVGWFETSAKENVNIEEAARFLVNKILQNDQNIKGNGIQDQIDGERFALNQGSTSSNKSCAC